MAKGGYLPNIEPSFIPKPFADGDERLSKEAGFAKTLGLVYRPFLSPTLFKGEELLEEAKEETDKAISRIIGLLSWLGYPTKPMDILLTGIAMGYMVNPSSSIEVDVFLEETDIPRRLLPLYDFGTIMGHPVRAYIVSETEYKRRSGLYSYEFWQCWLNKPSLPSEEKFDRLYNRLPLHRWFFTNFKYHSRQNAIDNLEHVFLTRCTGIDGDGSLSDTGLIAEILLGEGGSSRNMPPRGDSSPI